MFRLIPVSVTLYSLLIVLRAFIPSLPRFQPPPQAYPPYRYRYQHTSTLPPPLLGAAAVHHNMDQQSHHSFVDLDQHESQTDAEALEAIRVAIGQSADFNTQPLSDVLHDHDQDGEHEQVHEHVHGHGSGHDQADLGLLPQASGSASTSHNAGTYVPLEKSVNELLEVSQASLWEIETTIAPASREALMRIKGHGKKQLQMIKELLDLVKQHPQGCTSSPPRGFW